MTNLALDEAMRLTGVAADSMACGDDGSICPSILGWVSPFYYDVTPICSAIFDLNLEMGQDAPRWGSLHYDAAGYDARTGRGIVRVSISSETQSSTITATFDHDSGIAVIMVVWGYGHRVIPFTWKNGWVDQSEPESGTCLCTIEESLSTTLLGKWADMKARMEKIRSESK